MKMLTTLALLAQLIVIFPDTAGAQVDPCASALPTLTVVNTSTNKVSMYIDDYNNTFNGAPVWTDVELKVVAKGAGPAASPVVPSHMSAKLAWTLVAGTANCYTTSAAGSFLFSVPPNIEYDLHARKSTSAVTGPWSGNTVPFGRPAPPSAGTGLRITP